MKGRKIMKKLKNLTIILIILLVCMISFIGIYVQKQNRMENIIKEFKFGMNIKGYREVRLEIADGQEINDEKLEQVKKKLEKRLKELGSEDYIIRTNNGTGELVIELDENNNTDRVVSNLYSAGNFKIVDSEDSSNVLLNNNDIEDVSVKYNTTESGTTVYLDIKFTKDGSNKIKELSSNKYKTLENTNTTEDTSENSTEVNQPKIKMIIDNTEIITTSFDEPVTTGALQLSLSTATIDTDMIQESINQGLSIATILNNGPLDIEYNLTGNQYIYSNITNNILIVFSVIIAIIVVIALVILIIKYKKFALLASISYIGFIALYLLIIRYTNVVITAEGIAGIILILVINYLLIQKILTKLTIFDAYKEIFNQLIPVIITVIVFSFIKWTSIASFGMTMFWGLILTILYHIVVTRILLEENKKI